MCMGSGLCCGWLQCTWYTEHGRCGLSLIVLPVTVTFILKACMLCEKNLYACNCT